MSTTNIKGDLGFQSLSIKTSRILQKAQENKIKATVVRYVGLRIHFQNITSGGGNKIRTHNIFSKALGLEYKMCTLLYKVLT